jgi:heat shock protein HslJ
MNIGMRGRVAAMAVGGLVLSGLSACQALSDRPAEPWPQDLVGTRWLALGLSPKGAGSMDELKERAPNLQFISLNQVSGTGSCNRYVAKAEILGDSARFGPPAATRMMCPAETSANESVFFQALEATRKLQRDGRQLSLLDENGRVLLVMTVTP